jgi:hypothetical protein
MADPLDAWVAEFASAPQVLRAARVLRDRGYRELDLYSPYELEEAPDVLGLARPEWLPRAVLICGLSGAALGYGIQVLTNAWLYPLAVGARPPHSPPAFVPITFESGILLGALAAFIGLLAAGAMMRLWQPIFDVPDFERATVDRYWLLVRGTDVRFDPEDTRTLLESLDPLRLEPVGSSHGRGAGTR